MITYSTNWMGPISPEWYEKNNIPMVETDRTYSRWLSPEKAGETYLSHKPSVAYSGGRIDIYGLDEQDYYCGTSEYGVSVMESSSWHVLTDWLDDFTSEDLLEYTKLIELFESETGHKIEWFEPSVQESEDGK